MSCAGQPEKRAHTQCTYIIQCCEFIVLRLYIGILPICVRLLSASGLLQLYNIVTETVGLLTGAATKYPPRQNKLHELLKPTGLAQFR